MYTKYPKGSEWRKWDLHLHTPESFLANEYNCSFEELGKKIKDENLKVVGVTNYFIVKEKEVTELNNYLGSEYCIIPNFEFRISDKNKNAEFINIHVLFNLETTSFSEIYKCLGRVELNNVSEDRPQYCNIDNINKYGAGTVTVSLDGLLKELKAHFKEKQDYLVAGVCDGYGGFRPDRKKRNINTALKIDKEAHVIFGKFRNRNFFLNKEGDRSKDIKELKSVISCSDAHTINEIGENYTWIKANPTFEGLKYLLYEPEDRIFIGSKPELHTRVKNNQTRYINKLIINQVDGHNQSKGVCFKDNVVYPSKELTAIIGNKGKGKSAITDIIGLLGNSHNYDYFSFLNRQKFHKGGLSENFKAKLIWESGLENKADLNDGVDRDLEEKVKYLPQSYFEDLCNEIENNANFKKEINQVVFTHLDETERNEKATFEEFINLKKQNAEGTINDLRQQLANLNEDLVELQKKGTDEYKKGVQSKIEIIKEEIESHRYNKPLNPYPNEEDESEDDDNGKGKNFKKIQKATQDLSNLSENEEKLVDKLTVLNNDLTKFSQIKYRFESEKTRISNFRDDESKELEPFGISIGGVFPKPKINLIPIKKAIDQKENKKLEVELQLGRADYKFENHKELFSSENELLCKKIKIKKTEIEKLSKSLDDKEKAIESFKAQMLQWKKNLVEKRGSVEQPSPGTLNYFKKQLEFITNELEDEIQQKKNFRESITKDIYDQKKSIVDIYSHFKSNIDKKLTERMIDIKEYEISLEASMQIRNFTNIFLEFIDKGKAGSFRGQEEAETAVKKVLEDTEVNDEESIIELLRTITDKLEYTNQVKQNLFSQIKESKDLKELYDYMYGLKYLDEKYELKFSGKSIEQLSPGERGSALIVFYLLLDNDEKPLIIDQPEDNLDNQSVFEVLVPFIRQAKKKRQLIIVTHNPNLAVVADAEQIIHVELDKKNNNRFSLESGGIEYPKINKGIIDILEGTKPAFDKRKMKYLEEQN
jgi:ABC-type lipoprotein export system ATPase subunit